MTHPAVPDESYFIFFVLPVPTDTGKAEMILSHGWQGKNDQRDNSGKNCRFGDELKNCLNTRHIQSFWRMINSNGIREGSSFIG